MTLKNYFRLLAEDKTYATRESWLWRPTLKIASVGYGFGSALLRACYRLNLLKRYQFDLPVVSVGNITWGGTGKTPMVEYLTRLFLDSGKVPLILARGYGNDESREMVRKLPEAQFGFGKDRFRSGRKALSEHKADVVILDDGFQHWPMKRDLDIVVVNALNPFGNGSLIPRGILREPGTHLNRADVVVLNDVNLVGRKEVESLKERILGVSPKAEVVEAFHEPLYFYRPDSGHRVYLERMQGTRITSFSGIGTPRSFQMLLTKLGLRIVRNFEFSDHHPYTEAELKEICEMKQLSDSQEIVTTEKDYYRSENLMKNVVKPLVLKVHLRFTSGEANLRNRLNQFIQNGSQAVPVGVSNG